MPNHEHDMQPVSRTGTNAPGRPRAMPDPYEKMPSSESGLDVRATCADAILAAKRHLDEAERAAEGVILTPEQHIDMSQAWSALAYACSGLMGRR